MSQAVIVTGAGGAIGSAIAARLAADGWGVVGLDRAFPSDVPVPMQRVEQDLADRVGLRGAIARIVAAESVAGLVNCAGIAAVGSFLDQDEPVWDQLIDINLTAAIITCQAVLPAMIDGGGGAIVNIISDSARVGAAGEAVYSGAKGGVAAFSKSLAQEVGRHHVRVNCVSPGPVRTPMSAGNPELMAKLARKTPMKRVAEPGDIAGAVAFFLGRDSAFITGQTLSVSGGLTMAG